jgi:hypothetical protein
VCRFCEVCTVKNIKAQAPSFATSGMMHPKIFTPLSESSALYIKNEKQGGYSSLASKVIRNINPKIILRTDNIRIFAINI